MRLEAWGGSEIGHVRTRNEDSFALRPTSVDSVREMAQALFAVADGMGGHPGGDVASSLAVAAVLETERNAAEPEREWLARMHDAAQASIELRARQDPRLGQMGTTLTVALVSEGLCWINHVGDTRLYWVRGSRIAGVTRDHTVAQEMVDAGRLAASASDGHPMGNVLTRCLGVCPDQRADRPERPLALHPGDCLILATDGLIKTMAPDALPAMLASRSVEDAGRAMLASALSNGAPDNVTVVLVRVLESPPASASATGAETFDEVAAPSSAQ